MAFKDRPIVDKNSELSEESVREIKSVFSRKNGFISRDVEESGDYGVDIFSELIVDDRASTRIVPIQAKSTARKNIVSVNGQQYISTPFETSRLGYLLEFKPSNGLILLFDEENGVIHYDFCYEILTRIRLVKTDDSWEDQDKVTIHFLLENTLDQENINALYTRLFQTFQNEKKMYADHAEVYNLPELDEGFSSIDFLKEHGHSLYSVGRHVELIEYLEKLSRRDTRDNHIAYLGALAYTESGDLIEAHYYLSLCQRQLSNYSEEDRFHLRICEYRFEYFAGKKSREELEAILKEALSESKSEKTQLVAELGLLELRMRKLISSYDFDASFFDEINVLKKQISESKLDNSAKHLNNMYLSNIQTTAACRRYTDLLLEDFSNTGLMTQNEFRNELDKVSDIFEEAHSSFVKAQDYAIQNRQDLLLTCSYFYLAMATYSFYFALYTGQARHPDQEFVFKDLSFGLGSAHAAYVLYKKIGMIPSAYKAIILAYDIHAIARLDYGIDLNEVLDIKEINEEIDSFSKKEFRTNWDSVIETSYKKREAIAQKLQDPMRYMDDEEMELVAEEIIRRLRLPSDRITNILNVYKSIRYFKNNNQSPNCVLDILNSSESNGFKNPPLFQISNKSTNEVIGPERDIKVLLERL